MMLPNINWTDKQIIEYFGVPDNTKIIPMINENPYGKYFPSHFPNCFIGKKEVLSLRKNIYLQPEKIRYSLFNKRKSYDNETDYCIASIDNEHPAKVTIDIIIDSIELVYMIEALYHSVMHRFNKPAYLRYDKGVLSSEAYYKNGMRHNNCGPAYRINVAKGRWQNYFYINGQPLTKDLFFERYNVT